MARKFKKLADVIVVIATTLAEEGVHKGIEWFNEWRRRRKKR